MSALIPEADRPANWNQRSYAPQPEKAAPHGPSENLCEIPMEYIQVNPSQPRVNFNEESLNELAASIKEYGIIQPVTLRRIEKDKYQIISGGRRFRAAKLCGLKTLPAYVVRAGDRDVIAMALIENIQREDLDAIEIAVCFKRLLEECNLTQEGLSQKVGKDRTTISNYIRLLKLPAPVQLLIRSGLLGMGHARALLALEEKEDQTTLARTIVRDGLSVRQTENIVKNMQKSPSPVKKTQPQLPDSYCRVMELIGPYFDNRVSIKRNAKGKGCLSIYFSSDAQIEDLLYLLEKK